MTVSIDFLGGCNPLKIGANSTMISVEEDGKEPFRCLVDIGSIFSSEDNQFSSQRFLPNFLPYLGKIDAIAFTHGHLDHIDALRDYLFCLKTYMDNNKHRDDIKVPTIIANEFTYKLIDSTLPPDLKVFFGSLPTRKFSAERPEVSLGPVSFEGISVAHSIPEACAFFIRTKEANILHMGDYRTFDHANVGHAFNWKRFVRLAKKEGIDYIIDDSTRANSDVPALQAKQIEGNLSQIFNENMGKRVIGTMISSNMEGLYEFALAAKKAGRKDIFVSGSRMGQLFRAALSVGIFPQELANSIHVVSSHPDSALQKKIESLPPTQQAWVVSGCQNEPYSALQRLSEGKPLYNSGDEDKPAFTLSKDDTVISLQGCIPSNEFAVTRLYNKIAEYAGKIYLSPSDCSNDLIDFLSSTREKISPCLCYTSGHANKIDKEAFLSTVQEHNIHTAHYIAFHGNPEHLKAAEICAQNSNIPLVLRKRKSATRQTIVLEDGKYSLKDNPLNKKDVYIENTPMTNGDKGLDEENAYALVTMDEDGVKKGSKVPLYAGATTSKDFVRMISKIQRGEDLGLGLYDQTNQISENFMDKVLRDMQANGR